MPVYEYRCKQCGTVSEFLVSRMGASPADLKCHNCGGTRMTKALSTIAVHSPTGASPCESGQCPVPVGQRTCAGGRCNL